MEWKKVKLGEVCSILGDGIHGTPVYDIKGTYFFVNGNNLDNGRIVFKEDTKKVDKSEFVKHKKDLTDRTILISINGTLGNTAKYNGEPCILGKSACYFNVLPEYDRDFIYYLVTNSKFKADLERMATGTTIKNVSLKSLREYELSIPPIETQRRIAAILSSLDDKIENNNRINRNLEAQAQALFKSWFVDFEPWGGIMPEDWREGTIADLVDLLNGFAFKSSDFVANGFYNLITIKGVQDGKMTTDGADHLDVIPAKMPNWCRLQKGDILLSLTGNVGRCCLVDIENCLLNQRVAKLQPKTDYNRLYVYTLFRQEEMKARMISISRGTAQMNLSPIETGKLSIIIPTDKILADFGMRYNGILYTILNNISENKRLATLRDTLLPKLMKGEIEV